MPDIMIYFGSFAAGAAFAWAVTPEQTAGGISRAWRWLRARWDARKAKKEGGAQ